MPRSKKQVTQRGFNQPQEATPAMLTGQEIAHMEEPKGTKKARAVKRVRQLIPDVDISSVPFREEELVKRSRKSSQYTSYSARLLPVSFGDVPYALLDCLIEPNAEGQFGMKVKNIDERCVVRRFYPDPFTSPAAQQLRSNDVVVAVGNLDARAHPFEDVVQRIAQTAQQRLPAAIRVARPLLDNQYQPLPPGAPIPLPHVAAFSPAPASVDEERCDHRQEEISAEQSKSQTPVRVPHVVRPSLRRVPKPIVHRASRPSSAACS